MASIPQISLYPTVLLSLGDNISIRQQQYDSTTAAGLLFGLTNPQRSAISLRNLEFGCIPVDLIKPSTLAQFPPSKSLTQITHGLDSTIYHQVYSQRAVGWYYIDLVAPSSLSTTDQAQLDLLKHLLYLDKPSTQQSSIRSSLTLQQRAMLFLLFSIYLALSPQETALNRHAEEYSSILADTATATTGTTTTTTTTPPQPPLTLFFLPNIIDAFAYKQFPQLAASLPFATGLFPIINFPVVFNLIKTTLIPQLIPTSTSSQFETLLKSNFPSFWDHLPALHQKTDEADQITSSYTVPTPTTQPLPSQTTSPAPNTLLKIESLVRQSSTTTSASGKQTNITKLNGFDENASGYERGNPSLPTQLACDLTQRSQEFRQHYIQSVQTLQIKLAKLNQILITTTQSASSSSPVEFPPTLIQSIKHILLTFSLNPLQSLAYPQPPSQHAPASNDGDAQADLQTALQQVHQQDAMVDELLLQITLQLGDAALSQALLR